MSRLTPLLSFLAVLTLSCSSAYAQADAEENYQKAKNAYGREEFPKALRLAEEASETDPKNPEVFLLLGKAHYQVGNLDQAMQAWEKTLSLAPEEPFAARMLKVLRAARAEVDDRIELLQRLVQNNVYKPVFKECRTLLKDKAITAKQRASIMTVQAKVYLCCGREDEAIAVIQKVRELHSEHADPARTKLILGQAKLRKEIEKEALELLGSVVKEHKGAEAAKTARFEILSFKARTWWDGSVDPEVAAEFSEWLSGNPSHPMAPGARETLLRGYLSLSRRGGVPSRGSSLRRWDRKAVDVASDICKTQVDPRKNQEIAKRLVNHLDELYASNGAYKAASEGASMCRSIQWRGKGALLVLKALGRYKSQLGLRDLREKVRAGKLPSSGKEIKLPEELSEALSVCDLITKEFPAEPAWDEKAELAAEVQAVGRALPAPAEPETLRPTGAWALKTALSVIKANKGKPGTTSVKTAVATAEKIIEAYASAKKPTSLKTALYASRNLIEALSPGHSSWLRSMFRHAQLLDSYARYLFHENLSEGRGEENSGVSEPQQEFIATLKQVLEHNVRNASNVFSKVQNHLKPWTKHGYWKVAEQIYKDLAARLPAGTRLKAELSIVKLWKERVFREHKRLSEAGLQIPREIDPILSKALKRCRELQKDPAEGSGKLEEVRAVWDSIVAHYEDLEYYSAAKKAMQIKAAPPVAAALEYADFQIGRHTENQARRSLKLALKKYGAEEKLSLLPGFKEAVAKYKKFITTYPESPLLPKVVQRMFSIGRLYEHHNGFDVAHSVYEGFAEFASGQKVLSFSSAGKPSVAERAAFKAADALFSGAKNNLASQEKAPAGKQWPPQTLSKGFKAAISAYRGFVDSHPGSVLIGNAIGKIMAVGYEYARIGAWDAAYSVYADLREAGLGVSRPERLEFCKALCKLGHAIPSHAKKVLKSITSEAARTSRTVTVRDLLAWRDETNISEDALLLSIDPAKLRESSGEVEKEEASAAPAGPSTLRPAPAGEAGSLAERTSAEAERRDAQLLAMIQQAESNRAAQVADLRGQFRFQPVRQQQPEQQVQGMQVSAQAAGKPALSPAELARQQKAIDSAYRIFQKIRSEYKHTLTAKQCRSEILLMVNHWRGLRQWKRSAELAGRFLKHNPQDPELPKIRLEVAKDLLAWASSPGELEGTKQEILSEISGRFEKAREEFRKVVNNFPEEEKYKNAALWQIATSFLKQARAVGSFSATLSQGRYVRSAEELLRVAEAHPGHPNIDKVPDMLWGIAGELERRGHYKEAIRVWDDLRIYKPLHSLSREAALKIAQTYQNKLKRPLRAAKVYKELNFARGGQDQNLQNAIFQIGSNLKDQKRWVEALHVLENFVYTFPHHKQAGRALTMVGQIHQSNRAWEDAIKAYRRVMDEFKDGKWVKEAKWAIAESKINLSRWQEASESYREYIESYRKDSQVQEANRRIEVLKDLVRYQGLVDEKGQRKAFDAQYQIASIVKTKLSNPVKGIIEYRKVVERWPKSHLADDALYAVGTTYLDLGRTEKARDSLLEVSKEYPESPLADDALFMVGKSYENEARNLATTTRAETRKRAKELAQQEIYREVQHSRKSQKQAWSQKISELKKAGKSAAADLETARQAAIGNIVSESNALAFAQKAFQKTEALTAAQLADRQDKINASLRNAVEAYSKAAHVAAADKADEALLRMATIYDEKLNDPKAAMETWLQIVDKFSGTAVAEDASWRVAKHYERQGKHRKAIDAYKSFLRNYRRSPKAGAAQFAVAENYERLDEWVHAMDAYTNYLNNFPDGELVSKAKEQINWIKTYRL